MRAFVFVNARATLSWASITLHWLVLLIFWVWVFWTTHPENLTSWIVLFSCKVYFIGVYAYLLEICLAGCTEMFSRGSCQKQNPAYVTHQPHVLYIGCHMVMSTACLQVCDPESGSFPWIQDKSPAMELMPDTKIKADKGLADGTLYLPKPGHIEVTFDNSYSIFRYLASCTRDVCMPKYTLHINMCNTHRTTQKTYTLHRNIHITPKHTHRTKTCMLHCCTM